MRGTKAKKLMNKAKCIPGVDRKTTYDFGLMTRTVKVGDDQYLITDTIRLTKGCLREIYQDFKRFTKRHPNQSLA